MQKVCRISRQTTKEKRFEMIRNDYFFLLLCIWFDWCFGYRIVVADDTLTKMCGTIFLVRPIDRHRLVFFFVIYDRPIFKQEMKKKTIFTNRKHSISCSQRKIGTAKMSKPLKINTSKQCGNVTFSTKMSLSPSECRWNVNPFFLLWHCRIDRDETHRQAPANVLRGCICGKNK